jgi:hypothetical protein
VSDTVTTAEADARTEYDDTPPGIDEIMAVSRAMATAVAPDTGLTHVQGPLLRAITKAVTGQDIDYYTLEPLGSDELARVLARRKPAYRQRLVHHMVLAELVLTPIPEEVAQRVAAAARALGVDDDFVDVARQYAKGALGLAWNELRREGFVERVDTADLSGLHAAAKLVDPWEEQAPDAELEARWRAFADLPEGTLGRAVADMYRERAFFIPGTKSAASAYLAQHDFVHVLADYGTTIEGELEVFAFVGRADPDPKGFAWLATMVGLFETGYIHQQGFFQANVRDRHLDNPGMNDRLADAIWRGKLVSEAFGHDLFQVDYHELADRPIEDIRKELCFPPKSEAAIAGGSVGPFDAEGLTEFQRDAACQALEKPDPRTF